MILNWSETREGTPIRATFRWIGYKWTTYLWI